MTNPLRDNFKFELNNFNDDYYLYFGRLSYEKGIIELVKSFKSMNNRLIILGTGELRETILGVISLYNLNDRVQLLGFKKGKELVEIIKHAKFIVVPSKWYENCPYSVMESMALGKPVIVSNFGGLPELVKDEETGFIYKDDLSPILNLSEKIDDSEYGKLCANSLNFAKELFNMKKYVINLLDLITSKGS